MNKTVIFNEIGSPDILKIVEQSIPSPIDNEVVVKIASCGLNRAEYLFFQGQYLFTPTFPSKLGIEASGVVHSTTYKSKFKEGDEVCLLPSIDIMNYGYLGEYVQIPEEHIIHKPSSLRLDQAAAFWMAYGTAYGLLILEGGLSENDGKIVLITAASSSVGIASIQIAKSQGAQVIATTRTQSKKEFLLSLGADYVVVTNDESISDRISDITNGKGFDLAIDAVTGKQVGDLAEVAAMEAKIILYGVLDFTNFEFPLFPVLGKGLKISGFHYVFHLLNHSERKSKMVNFLLDGLAKEKYDILIDKVFSLDEISAAYSYMESNLQKGKILITI